MEYIKVKLSKSLPDMSKIPVIINGQKNGYINRVIEIGSGYMEISAIIIGYQTVKNTKTTNVTIQAGTTTMRTPKEVIVNVD